MLRNSISRRLTFSFGIPIISLVKSNTKIVAVLFCLCLAGLGYWFLGNKRGSGRPIIGITQIVSHPSLDEVRAGIISGLKEEGYEDGKNVEIMFRNANGDPSLTVPIAESFAQRPVSVMVPITTPSALACAKSSTSIPIVFGGVTDPVGVGLVKDLKTPGANITGTCDRWPIAEQIKFFKEILPGLKTLAMLYKPGDDVSKWGVATAKEAAATLGIEIVERPVSSGADIPQVLHLLLPDVDAVYTGMDNLVVENIEPVLKEAAQFNKPVFAGDIGSITKGAAATVGISMDALGRETARIVARVIKGEQAGQIPIFVFSTGTRVINRQALQSLEIDESKAKLLGATLQ